MKPTFKTIPDTYRKNGFTYKLVRRMENAAIYSQTATGKDEPCHWEVVRVRFRNAKDCGNFQLEAGEYLPTTHEWGVHGWTMWTLHDAIARMTEIAGNGPNPVGRPKVSRNGGKIDSAGAGMAKTGIGENDET